MNVNKAIILGNLTRDPDVKTIPSGQTVASFSVATNRFWTDKTSGEKKKSAEYHNIIAWGRLAEIVQKFLTKGSLVYIEGRLQTRNWEDQQGNKKYKTEIIAEKIQLGPRGAGVGVNTNKENIEMPEERASSPEEINVEEIPF
ncbi:single-stranded DNA-binding protein [Candidatus Parcubacteria bacterium 4484_255]|nr:MAG: single-stranded DNA-binding protein [Candidatus Parcubacteria bacterium 4484_255]